MSNESNDYKVLAFVYKYGEFPANAKDQEFYFDVDWVDYNPEDREDGGLIVTEKGMKRFDLCAKRLGLD